MSEEPSLPPLVVPGDGDVPADSADVRSGPEIDPGLLLLLPLLGIWRGRGKGDGTFLRAGSDGPPEDVDFGQELRCTHDGRAVLAYESVAWEILPDGSAGPPIARERGWWRPRPGDGSDAVELLVAHDDGTVEVSVGTAVGTRFETVSDVVVRTAGEPVRLHRLFGVVEGDLLYAWDRETAAGVRPAMSARLRRVR